nr:peptidoglycan DD-metalloendopeptidase family protein [Shewanella sp. NIFS-20-20]
MSVPQKRVLLGGGLLLATALMWPSPEVTTGQRIALPLVLTSAVNPGLTGQDAIEALAPKPDFTATISAGDTLSQLFERAGVDQQTMYQVLEADLTVLALDTLQPGNTLRFYMDDNHQLTRLELDFSLARQVVFTLVDGSYDVEEIHKQGQWQPKSVSGDIYGSFYVSASKAGLSASQIQRVESILKEKVNFSRDLQAGDRFSVVVSEQYIDGDASGASEILAVDIVNRGKSINAYQFSDGQYYDAKGESLARAFLRTPLVKSYRLSSHFNGNRRHPVTGRLAPHNGTDFATPTGTQVIAPGDGIVSLVTDHRFAGKYIVIDHGNQYRTRYLHLSKSLVRKGQRVTRGQPIALTGNTGRTTGPHLHYEFHINGRAVNAMKAKIPMASRLTKSQMGSFQAMVSQRDLQMGV